MRRYIPAFSRTGTSRDEGSSGYCRREVRMSVLQEGWADMQGAFSLFSYSLRSSRLLATTYGYTRKTPSPVTSVAWHCRIIRPTNLTCVITKSCRNPVTLEWVCVMKSGKYLQLTNPFQTIVPKHLIEKNEFKCPCCSKVFDTKLSFVQHFKSHMAVQSYPCPYCELSAWQSLPELLSHISSVHLVDRQSIVVHRKERFECEICDTTSILHQEHRKHYNRRHKLRAREQVIGLFCEGNIDAGVAKFDICFELWQISVGWLVIWICVWLVRDSIWHWREIITNGNASIREYTFCNKRCWF